jgi:hypothetical protein
VPLVVAGVTHGTKKLFPAGVIAGFVIYIITGNVFFAYIYFLLFLLPALMASQAVNSGYNALTSIITGFLCLSAGFGVFVQNILRGRTDEFESSLTQIFSTMSIMLKNQGLQDVEITGLFEQVRDTIPLMITGFFLILVILNYLVSQYFLIISGSRFPVMPCFNKFHGGVLFCVLFLGAVSIAQSKSDFIFTGLNAARIKITAKNIMVICRAVFFINAVSLILWFLDKKQMPDYENKWNYTALTLGLLALLLVYIKELTGLLIIFGITDSIFDFRRFKKRCINLPGH